jgi:hypothetical protein
VGRESTITIERVYSDDPADWEEAAEALARVLTPNLMKPGNTAAPLEPTGTEETLALLPERIGRVVRREIHRHCRRDA